MRRCAGLLLCAVLLAAVPAACTADEGMWPIEMVDKLPWSELKAMGLQLQPKDIYDGKGHGIAHAIVSLGGGTGSFVSPNGLILTNHHVAFGAIQRASTSGHNYLAEGFFAAGMEDEIEARGGPLYQFEEEWLP